LWRDCSSGHREGDDRQYTAVRNCLHGDSLIREGIVLSGEFSL
jgi:hypothetical protein